MSSILSLVKTTQSFATEFVGSTGDPCFTKGLVESSPLIYFNGSTFLFDYSQSKNINDLKFLKLFLNGLTAGSTFSFNNGKYANIETGSVVNFDGILSFGGKTGEYNQYFYGTGVTWTSGLSAGVYDRKKFIKPIQYSAVSGITASYLINHTPDSDPLNFTYMGIYGSDYNFEEYIAVDGSTYNNRRLKVKNALKLNDGKEIIYFDTSENIINENLFFQKVFVNLYMRGSMALDIASYDETINGILIINNPSPGIYSFLLDNQNRQQYALRESIIDDVQYQWYPNQTLKSFNTLSVSFTPIISYPYDAIYHLFCETTVIPELVASTDYTAPVFTGNQFLNSIYVDNLLTSTLTIQTQTEDGITFKIDLSDARNLNLIVEPFVDIDCQVPLVGDFLMLGTPGTEGAAFIYKKVKNQIQKSFYLKLTREQVNILYITIA
jgi:hypothetical protein